MRVAFSQCLLGAPVRYDGGSVPSAAVQELAARVEAIAVCPECAGGLPVPRQPVELLDGKALCKDGTDVTREFEEGAAVACEAANGVSLAVLKEKSPSCGSSFIYDGSHTGRVVPGAGIFARRLRERGVCIVSENEVEWYHPSVEHPIAIVLGSGLGHLGSLVKPVRRISYSRIDGFPEDARPVLGHRYEATVGTIDGVPVVVYPGRIHLYQGYSAQEVTSLVRHAHSLGCRGIIFACATGAIYPNGKRGLSVITDHLNLTARNPLVGTEPLRGLDTPFIGMTDAYTPYLREIAKGVAADLGIELGEGVYAGLLGPNFETPAEVRMLATMGASHAGMSLVNEVIMARALDMGVLGITLATNVAGEGGLSHADVLADAAEHADDFERLVRGILALL